MGKAGRWKRKAEVVGPLYGQIRPPLLTPIFDPQIMKSDESGMYLQGVQRFSIDDDRVAEFVQVWRCTPAP